MSSVKLQDEEWMKIQSFLRQCPQVKVGSARKCRRFVEATLWILRSGEQWRFDPDAPPLTTIRGSAAEFCEVAARRVEAGGTDLVGTGPDSEAVLRVVRTYAL